MTNSNTELCEVKRENLTPLHTIPPLSDKLY